MTGFNPKYENVQANDLTATYTIDFSGNKGMYNKFSETWSDDKRWSFDSKPYTATFTFIMKEVI